MSANRKYVFVKDKMRESYLATIYARIARNKSSLISGNYGCGKTELLNQITAISKKVISVDSLGTPREIIKSLLAELGVKVNRVNLKDLNRYKFVMKIDEANDLPRGFYPYLKRIMDVNPVVMAGLSDEGKNVEQFLADRHPDILSRFRVLNLSPVNVDELMKAMDQRYEQDAVKMLYGAVGGNMRLFHDLCDDCADKAVEMKSPKVTVPIAAMFV
jgi:hypothetical protein